MAPDSTNTTNFDQDTTIYFGQAQAINGRLFCCTRISAWYPEILLENSETGCRALCLHPAEIIAKCPSLVGKTIVTASEHLILWFQKQVRDKHIAPDQVRILHVDRCTTMLSLDANGDFIDDCPGGFFTERLDLLR